MMLENAEKYKLEDEEYRKKVKARIALEDYAYEMRKSISDAMICAELSETKKRLIEIALNEMSQWLENNRTAEAKEFLEWEEELENICGPAKNAH